MKSKISNKIKKILNTKKLNEVEGYARKLSFSALDETCPIINKESENLFKFIKNKLIKSNVSDHVLNLIEDKIENLNFKIKRKTTQKFRQLHINVLKENIVLKNYLDGA
jgi:lipopolysaccharide export LptBFGC system permease protein LptF